MATADAAAVQSETAVAGTVQVEIFIMAADVFKV